MSMNPDAQFTQANMVRFERSLPGTVEAVWAVLTEPRRLPAWYGEDGVIEGRVGGTVNLLGGHIRGSITQWRPVEKLAYTWNVFNPGQAISDYPESYLTLEIGNAKLTLTHLPVLEKFVKLNAMGWHTYLDMVEAAVRGEKIEDRAVHMKRNALRYGVDLSKLPKG